MVQLLLVLDSSRLFDNDRCISKVQKRSALKCLVKNCNGHISYSVLPQTSNGLSLFIHVIVLTLIELCNTVYSGFHWYMEA